MNLASIAEAILRLLLLVGVGVVLRASGVLEREDARPLNTVIIYVGVPALVFRAVHPAPIGPELLGVTAAAWVATLSVMGLAWLGARALRLSRPATGALVLASALGNTGYIGYPLSQALLGEAGLSRAVFYDLFGTVLALLTVGFAVAARMGGNGGRVNVVREVVRFPAFAALAAALVLRGVSIPNPVSHGLEALATMTVPLIMISVGVTLKPAEVRRQLTPVLVAGGLKLVVAPLVALGAAFVLLAGQPEAQRLVVLEAGMPSMMLALVIGMRFGLDTDLIASAIVVTTAASVVTVPLMQLLAS